MAELQIRALRKTYPGAAAPVLQGIDLDVAAGEFMVFVGPSGCGKSTLLRAIAGLEPVDGGDIVLDGASIVAQPPGERATWQSIVHFPQKLNTEKFDSGIRDIFLPCFHENGENRIVSSNTLFFTRIILSS